MSKYTRLDTPIRVGEYYRHGLGCYEVREAMPSMGEVLLHRAANDLSLWAHGAYLYDTPDGEQLLWESAWICFPDDDDKMEDGL